MKNALWIAAVSLLAVINVLVFWPGNLYFLNDDLLHIPLTDQGHLFQTNSVRPIHELLLRLDLLLWNKQAFGYHITALILHLIVCIQLYELCFVLQVSGLKIEKPQALKAALLAVFLFLSYPQSSESLGWILGRAPILSAVFLLLTIRLAFTEKNKWITYYIGTFFFAASLFTYEQTLLLPLWLFLVAFQEKRKEKRKSFFLYAATLLVADVAYLIVRKSITSEVVGTYEGGNLLNGNFASLAMNTLRIFCRLIINPAAKQQFIIYASVLLFVVGVLVLLVRKAHFNAKAIISFSAIIVLLIAPVISLGVAVNSFESGRYLYLPSIFFITGVSIVGVDVSQKNNRFRNWLLMFLLLLIGYWLTAKYKAGRYYTDASSYSKSIHKEIQDHFKTSSDTLFLDTLRVTVHRLPVFRRGFKRGINWFNDKIDTNKVVVRYFDDEVLAPGSK